MCEPSATFCQGNTVQLCDSTGSTFSLFQTCTTGQLCNPQTVTCAVPRCTPNQPACDGNVYTTCNAQGFGYTGTRTDCTTSDQFCGATGCTSSAVDTIPPMNPTLYTSGALSNYLMQTLICTVLFYEFGLGLGLYSDLERYQLYYVVAAIWAAELVWSPIWLHYFEGFSLAEVARLEGAPEGTVRSRVRSGLQRLALSLDDLLVGAESPATLAPQRKGCGA